MDVEGVFCMAKKNKSAGNGGRKVSAGIKLGVSLFVPLIEYRILNMQKAAKEHTISDVPSCSFCLLLFKG